MSSQTNWTTKKLNVECIRIERSKMQCWKSHLKIKDINDSGDIKEIKEEDNYYYQRYSRQTVFRA